MQIIPPASGIKSIQRGSSVLTTNNSINVSISPVVLSKSILNFSSGGGGGATGADAVLVTGKLSASNNIYFYRPSTVGTALVEWEVVEYG